MSKDDKNPFGGDFFDFGFSAVDESELDVLKAKEREVQQVSAGAAELHERLDKLYQSFQPLLQNLKKDADTKEYILWPDRKAKIESFERLLKNIYEGKA